MTIAAYPQLSADFYTDVRLGKIPGYALELVAGNGLVTTAYSPISTTLLYPTPTAAVSLEVLSSSANDTSAGSGARTITVTGLDANWAEISQVITMNGVTPVAVPTALLRVYKVVVTTSGTYPATLNTGSHAGTITVRVAGAGATWQSINAASGFPAGEASICSYTIPLGKTGYLIWKNLDIETTKAVDVRFLYRELANDVTVPYTGITRQLFRESSSVGESQHIWKAPLIPMVGPCDLGPIAAVTVGTANVSCDYMLLITTP